jgi:hypothetical protein
VSDSDRPIDLFLAALLAAQPVEGAEAKEALSKVGPEELDRVRRAIEAMAQTAGAEQSPAAMLRTVRGLLGSPRRLDCYVDLLARFFDFSEAEARALLARIDVALEWMEGPDAGIFVLPVAAGPRAQNALAALVRLPPGVTRLGGARGVARRDARNGRRLEPFHVGLARPGLRLRGPLVDGRLKTHAS